LHHKCNKHHGFISYRRCDRGLAQKLQLKLETLLSPVKQQLVIFRDETCCIGPDQMGICQLELRNSRFAIIIISERGIEQIINANNPRPDGGTGDNFLLELEIIVELVEEHKIGGVFVLFADGLDANGHNVQFNMFDRNRYPTDVHTHPLSLRRKTIRQTMDKILDIGGKPISEERFEDKIPILQEFIHTVLNRTYLGDLCATAGKTSILGLNHLGYTGFTHSLGVMRFYGAGGYVLNSSSYGVGIVLHLLNDAAEIYEQRDYGDVNYGRYLIAHSGMFVGAAATVVVLSPYLAGASVIGICAAGVSEFAYWTLK
jgi:hypothetical protein